MCRRVTCRMCGKASWAGCGQHVEQVLAGVPRDQRCTCSRDAPGAAAPASSGRSLLGRLFGR